LIAPWQARVYCESNKREMNVDNRQNQGKKASAFAINSLAWVEQLGLLGRIGEVAQAIPGGGAEFHLIVLQHTDCGIIRLPGDPAMLAHYFKIGEEELQAKAITDPRTAVALDVALLRAIPAFPGEWLVSGLVYDVATGLIEVVVPPTAIRAAPIRAA
jgi:carbonic anhydrase